MSHLSRLTNLNANVSPKNGREETTTPTPYQTKSYQKPQIEALCMEISQQCFIRVMRAIIDTMPLMFSCQYDPKHKMNEKETTPITWACSYEWQEIVNLP